MLLAAFQIFGPGRNIALLCQSELWILINYLYKYYYCGIYVWLIIDIFFVVCETYHSCNYLRTFICLSLPKL